MIPDRKSSSQGALVTKRNRAPDRHPPDTPVSQHASPAPTETRPRRKDRLRIPDTGGAPPESSEPRPPFRPHEEAARPDRIPCPGRLPPLRFSGTFLARTCRSVLFCIRPRWKDSGQRDTAGTGSMRARPALSSGRASHTHFAAALREQGAVVVQAMNTMMRGASDLLRWRSPA